MEMDRPPVCYFASVQDGKQEIYLEWPKPAPARACAEIEVWPRGTKVGSGSRD